MIVCDGERKPVPDVNVSHVGESGKRHGLRRRFNGVRRDAFESWLLGPGKERVVVEAPGWRGVDKIVEVKAGEEERVEIEFSMGDQE